MSKIPEVTREFMLYKQLLMYVALSHKLKHVPTSYDMVMTDRESETIISARNLLVKNPQKEVLEYCKSNPFQLSDDALGIVGAWSGMKIISGFLMKYSKGFGLIMNEKENAIYAFQGINDRIENIIDKSVLPYQMTINLLPFKGNLIRDGLLSSHNVYCGGSMRKQLKQSFDAIVATQGIYYNFDIEESTSVSLASTQYLQDLIPMLDDDPMFFRHEIKKLIEKDSHCKSYYVEKVAKKFARSYKSEASLLGITGVYVVCYGGCVCGVAEEKKDAIAFAKKTFPDISESELYIFKV